MESIYPFTELGDKRGRDSLGAELGGSTSEIQARPKQALFAPDKMPLLQ